MENNFKHTGPPSLGLQGCWSHGLIGIKAVWPHVETRESHRVEHENGNYYRTELCGCICACQVPAYKYILYTLCPADSGREAGNTLNRSPVELDMNMLIIPCLYQIT